VRLFGNLDGSDPISLELEDWSMCAAAARATSVCTETFIAGKWKTGQLPGLIELLIRNRSVIRGADHGTWWGSLLYRVKASSQSQLALGQQENIHAHYDIPATVFTSCGWTVDELFRRLVRRWKTVMRKENAAKTAMHKTAR
jgi:hypothetical protein